MAAEQRLCTKLRRSRATLRFHSAPDQFEEELRGRIAPSRRPPQPLSNFFTPDTQQQQARSN
jgi:hypothetical protein